jgi:hypothetical protein
MKAKTRTFWVRFRGTIVDDADRCDTTSSSFRAFLAATTQEFSKHSDLSQPGVYSPGDGSITLAAVVEAVSAGDAILMANKAFDQAIKRAGGSTNWPTPGPPHWKAHDLGDLMDVTDYFVLPVAA